MVAGGLPCQGVSGLNKGAARVDVLADARNRLVSPYLGLIAHLRCGRQPPPPLSRFFTPPGNLRAPVRLALATSDRRPSPRPPPFYTPPGRLRVPPGRRRAPAPPDACHL